MKTLHIVINCPKCNTQNDLYSCWVDEDGKLYITLVCKGCGVDGYCEFSWEELMLRFTQGKTN